MACTCFVPKNFKPETLQRIEQANSIIAEYRRQGLTLTTRQLYYQFVTHNFIPNTERSYKNLANVVADARLAGLIDWDAIEDRTRVARTPASWDSIEQIVTSAVEQFRLDRWDGQEHYVELWVEKDALAGVLSPIAREYSVTLMVNRGYSSVSAMYEASLRFVEAARRRDCVLLYLGDHDPSGEDMVRDIRDRLDTFGAMLAVEKVALTMPQIEEHEPPPNPAKMTDSRAKGYVEAHGDSSWEVDALNPGVLNKLIRKALNQYVDRKKMAAIVQIEESEKARVRKAIEKAGIGKR